MVISPRLISFIRANYHLSLNDWRNLGQDTRQYILVDFRRHSVEVGS